MKQDNINRSLIIGSRLTTKEYEQVRKKCNTTSYRRLSEYVNRNLFERQVVTTYFNQSLDDFMAEAIQIKNELNSAGNNFNQAVKKLHSLQQISEFRKWLTTYEMEKKILFSKVEQIKNHIQKIGDKWLQ